jgi:glycosyltransferase involved in cell wall biosynthesis
LIKTKKRILLWAHSSNREGGGEADLRRFLQRFGQNEEYELFGVLPEGNDRAALARYLAGEAGCIPALFPISMLAVRAYGAYFIRSWQQIRQVRAFVNALEPEATIIFSSCLVMPFLYTNWRRKGKLILFVREFITPHWVRHALFKFLFKRADLIITVSEFLRREILKSIAHLNVQTVFSLPDLPEIDKPVVKRNADGRFHLAIVGGFSEVKGHDVLLRALHKLKCRNRALTLHLIGQRIPSGVHRPFLRRMERLVRALPDNFKIIEIGALRHEDLNAFLRAIDLLVIPSRAEGLSLTLMEAILLRVPVIAARIGEMKNILLEEKNGLLFESENAGDLAEKIDRFLGDPVLLERIAAQNGTLPSFLGDRERNWQKLEQALSKVLQR